MDERIVEGMDGGRRDERNARMEEGDIQLNYMYRHYYYI